MPRWERKVEKAMMTGSQVILQQALLPSAHGGAEEESQ